MYKKTQIKKFPPSTSVTSENRHWKQYKKAVAPTFSAKITDVTFCPTKPYDLAVTSASSITLMDGETLQSKKVISRFKDVAYSGSFRGDGQLLVAGCEDSTIAVFDIKSRIILRTITNHNAAVHVTKFSQNDLIILSASDDTTLRRWDLPTQEEVNRFSGHSDYVRAAVENTLDSNLCLSGSYDHTVKCWDARQKECVRTMDHGAPVESLVFLAQSNSVVSAGENEIKVWDLASGLVKNTFSNHQKTITCLCIGGDQTRLFSGSLDHHVKVYEINSFKVTHSFKFEAPVLSLAFSADGTTLAVGMTGGNLHLRSSRVQTTPSTLSEEKASSLAALFPGLQESTPTTPKRPRTGTKRYFTRGQNEKEPSSKDDFFVHVDKKQKLKPYDILLKKFQYRNALDAAFLSESALVIVSVLQELILRGGLRHALGARDETQLVPILRLITNQIHNPHYQTILLDVANVILDMYGTLLTDPDNQSPTLITELMTMKSKIDTETFTHKKLIHLLGSIDILLASQRTLTSDVGPYDDSRSKIEKTEGITQDTFLAS